MNFFSSLSRPLRLAAFALIGVALVAAAIGTVTALNGNQTGQNAAPPASSPADRPGTTSQVPPASSAPGSSAAPPSATTSPAAPPASQGTPGGQADAKWVPVRVYNNSLIEHLAAKAADDFRAAGWNISEVGPYPYGIIPTTTAYYTPGTDEETAAKALAQAFGMQAQPRFEGIQSSSPGVIVIVTKDYKGIQGKDG